MLRTDTVALRYAALKLVALNTDILLHVHVHAHESRHFPNSRPHL